MRKSKLHGRSLRTVLALSVAVTALAMLGALGGVGFAKSSVSAAQYQYGKDKVTICHKGKTIKVGKPAVKSHLKHRDTLGACASDKRKGKNKDSAKQRDEEKQKGDDDAVASESKGEREKAKSEAAKAEERAEHQAEKAKEQAEKRAEHEAEKAKEHAEKRAEHEAEKAEREAEKAKQKGKGK